MRYALLTAVADAEGAEPKPLLVDLHQIESALPDLTSKETWVYMKDSNNTYMVLETPEKILEMINEGYRIG